MQTNPGPGKKTGISPSTTNFNGHIPKSLVAYNSPRNDLDCRICQILESNGDTDSLYENHYSNFATGCPRYIVMSMEDRARVARLAKICLNCHNPDYRWKRQDKDHKCGTVSVNGKKSCYACTVEKCKTHLWVCVTHKDQNKSVLERFKR